MNNIYKEVLEEGCDLNGDNQIILNQKFNRIMTGTKVSTGEIILNESLKQVLDKILSGVYILSKDKDLRTIERSTLNYIYNFKISNLKYRLNLEILFLPYNNEKVILRIGKEQLVISGKDLEVLKSKLANIYTLPVYLGNFNGGVRGSWINEFF